MTGYLFSSNSYSISFSPRFCPAQSQPFGLAIYFTSSFPAFGSLIINIKMKKITETDKDEFEFEQRLAKSIVQMPAALQKRFKILKILSVSNF